MKLYIVFCVGVTLNVPVRFGEMTLLAMFTRLEMFIVLVEPNVNDAVCQDVIVCRVGVSIQLGCGVITLTTAVQVIGVVLIPPCTV